MANKQGKMVSLRIRFPARLVDTLADHFLVVAKPRKIPTSLTTGPRFYFDARTAHRNTNTTPDQLSNENYTERWATNDWANASI